MLLHRPKEYWCLHTIGGDLSHQGCPMAHRHTDGEACQHHPECQSCSQPIGWQLALAPRDESLEDQRESHWYADSKSLDGAHHHASSRTSDSPSYAQGLEAL